MVILVKFDQILALTLHAERAIKGVGRMAKIELALACNLDDLKKAFQDTSEDSLVKFIKSLLYDLSLRSVG